jgi:DNA polymerase III delta prime subunit
MHAYLFVGQGITNFQLPISNLATKLKAKLMEFPLVKIDDVRNLNNLVRLEFNQPTLIVCQNIHEAGEEALNAFLKNLEEPQENIYFALTTPSIKKVIPTIISRCQIIKITNDELSTTNFDEIKKFLKLSTGEKLSYVDKIKERGKAIEFAENMVNFLHGRLHKNDVKYEELSKIIEEVVKTLSGLKANGNVSLQLANLVVRMDT